MFRKKNMFKGGGSAFQSHRIHGCSSRYPVAADSALLPLCISGSALKKSLVELLDKQLLVQENKKDIKGKWDMPAGKLEDDENIIEAAIREVLEETGLDVNITGIIAMQENIASFGQLLIIYFKGEWISGSIKYDKEEIYHRYHR